MSAHRLLNVRNRSAGAEFVNSRLWLARKRRFDLRGAGNPSSRRVLMPWAKRAYEPANHCCEIAKDAIAANAETRAGSCPRATAARISQRGTPTEAINPTGNRSNLEGQFPTQERLGWNCVTPVPQGGTGLRVVSLLHRVSACAVP